jgi:hypothetical protein
LKKENPMPLKLTVGLSKKVGLPDYGSLCASCTAEFAVDLSFLQHDLEAFQNHVRHAYAACRQAVQDELAREQQAVASGNNPMASPASPDASAPPNGRGNGHSQNGSTNGNPRNGQNGHGASEKQFEYIRQLARQISGLGVRRLDALANRMFAKPLADLTSLDASGLIDALKDIKAGKIDLEVALNGGAP